MSRLEPFGHGGDLLTAGEQFGIDPTSLLDYSANINPLGPPEVVIQTIHHSLTSIIHYPDPAQRKFRQAVSERLQVPLEWILAGNGAAECMVLAILALAPRVVGVVYPCFSEYEALAKQFGAQVIGCYATEANEYKPMHTELYQLIKESDMVFIGTPNNPTGIVYNRLEMIQMAEWGKDLGTIVVFDEAFLDFVDESKQESLIDQLEQFQNVIIIRSLTKMYAIPGIRLGYTIAHPDVIKQMKQKQVTWSVNGLALEIGYYCMKETQFEAETRDLIDRERNFLRDELHARFQMKVSQSEANYLLVQAPANCLASDLQKLLGQQGILIRNCAMYPGLTPQAFRIAVRTREENLRLLTAISKVWSEWSEVE